jgi:hypothetical protein
VHGIAGAEAAAMAGCGTSGSATPTRPAGAAGSTRDKLGADGLLGVDVLKGRRVLLDFVQNRFEIAASSSGREIGRQNNSRIPRPSSRCGWRRNIVSGSW